MTQKNNVIKKHEKRRKRKDITWIIILVITTIVFSILMSSVSSIITQNVNLIAAVIIVITIVLIGIIFDIVGIAAAAVDEKPFHAMASSKVKASKYAIRLARNANKVATFCNDVVGDVCSVIGGSTSAFIVLKLSVIFKGIDIYILGVLISSTIAGLTVFGKGLGKSYAITNSNKIVYRVALMQYYILRGLTLFGFKRRHRKKC